MINVLLELVFLRWLWRRDIRRAFPQTPAHTSGGINRLFRVLVLGLLFIIGLYGLYVLAVSLTTQSKQPISHRKAGTTTYKRLKKKSRPDAETNAPAQGEVPLSVNND